MATMAKPGALTPLPSPPKALTLMDKSSSVLLPNFGDSRLRTQLNVTLKLSRKASILPVIRAQSSPGYVPDSKFYKVEAILRSWRVPLVSSALLKIGIRGVTISDVRGFGSQGGSAERHGGSEFFEDNFVAKVKMEIVVSKDQVEAVIAQIVKVARTGEIGDGKIFRERGERAERMSGGRSDMSSAT
ncbi:hypothetical protein CJ030_MR7G014368 [Morella rubra]|uniref:Nitrogen regulatory protein P-II n=1 Tax=Morella rubra TaxID=262757 RepID=A0A6A1V0Q2_9ROSI|nr:hypothetical protein CJ030_MR7G014340 [Morella rubra]KAB1206223.1 hypothetical protein CJ030_MR7G014368 [Morella rubra]